MARPPVVRFSVRWTGAHRVLLWIPTVLIGGLVIGLNYLFWFTDEVTGPGNPPDERWWARGIGLFLAWPAAVLLATVRFRVWLRGGRLIKQGAFLRTAVDLRGAKFSMTMSTWHYTRRLGPARLRRITIAAPTLVVRAPPLRRIKLPLATRTGHDLVGGRVIVRWLPQSELDALAAAIERYGTASGSAEVARYLRNVSHSAVQPNAAIDRPFG